MKLRSVVTYIQFKDPQTELVALLLWVVGRTLSTYRIILGDYSVHVILVIILIITPSFEINLIVGEVISVRPHALLHDRC